jgi:hypothetical protein
VRSEFRPATVVRKSIETAFPRLKHAPWKVKSPFDRTYKCIAWAACRTDNIWWPHGMDPVPRGLYWPPGIPHDTKVDTFVKAFERLGYRRCDNEEFEVGYQKVAIYAWDEDTTTHMARQHFLGRGWLSKPGQLEDILRFTLDSIGSDPPYRGDDYGRVFQILKRSWPTAFCRFCLFRCGWYAFRFWLYRCTHPSWKTGGIT